MSETEKRQITRVLDLFYALDSSDIGYGAKWAALQPAVEILEYISGSVPESAESAGARPKREICACGHNYGWHHWKEDEPIGRCRWTPGPYHDDGPCDCPEYSHPVPASHEAEPKIIVHGRYSPSSRCICHDECDCDKKECHGLGASHEAGQGKPTLPPFPICDKCGICLHCGGTADDHKRPCSNCGNDGHAAWECVFAPAASHEAEEAKS